MYASRSSFLIKVAGGEEGLNYYKELDGDFFTLLYDKTTLLCLLIHSYDIIMILTCSIYIQ